MDTLLSRNVKIGTIVTGADSNGDYPFTEGLGQYRNIGLTFTGDNTSSMVLKVKGSRQQTIPDFSSAISPSNSWFYVQTVENNTGNPVTGSTGYTFTADRTVGCEVNTDVLNWVSVEISGYVSGDMTIEVEATNNT